MLFKREFLEKGNRLVFLNTNFYFFVMCENVFLFSLASLAISSLYTNRQLFGHCGIMCPASHETFNLFLKRDSEKRKSTFHFSYFFPTFLLSKKAQHFFLLNRAQKRYKNFYSFNKEERQILLMGIYTDFVLYNTKIKQSVDNFSQLLSVLCLLPFVRKTIQTTLCGLFYIKGGPFINLAVIVYSFRVVTKCMIYVRRFIDGVLQVFVYILRLVFYKEYAELEYGK